MILDYDNIFEAVTANTAEAEELKQRSNLTIKIREQMQVKLYSKAIAAKLMRISEEEVSKIIDGQITYFNSAQLLECYELLT